MNLPPASGYAAEEPTHPPPWHGLVVWDIFFNALTTGLFLVVAVGELTRPETFAPVGVWAYPLALVLLLIDLSFLVLDLGDKLRFHHMLRVFKPSSPMSLGTWCLTLYSFPLAWVVALDLFGQLGLIDPQASGVELERMLCLVVALPFAFGSMAYKGVLFSTSAQPGWRDARWLGAYHVASAFAVGAALALAVAKATGTEVAVKMLRPTVGVLLLVQSVPLILLLIELKPTLTAVHSRGRLIEEVVTIFAVGIILPLVLLPFGGLALFSLAGAWSVRRLVVTLPHAVHSRHTVR